MEYKVMIDAFEGPLDLLLHLIKKSNIDICDINILDITKQYLEYINKMERLNLDIASEYLIMAAELIEMKSNILLPKPDIEEVEQERENLINRLLDYEHYKNITTFFKEKEIDRREIFTKEPEDLKKYGITSNVIIQNDLKIEDLVNALNKFLSKKELEKPLNTKITTKEYSITKRSEEILNILKIRKKIKFEELFEIYDKSFIVVTFLALLDLVKKSNIIVKQDNNFESISLEGVI